MYYNATLSTHLIREMLSKIRYEPIQDIETPTQISVRLKKDISALQIVLMELVDRIWEDKKNYRN